MTLEEIKAAVLAGKRVCWATTFYEVVHDNVGQWLIRCVDNDYCVGLTWEDNATLNGKPEDFFVAPPKPARETALPVKDLIGGHHPGLSRSGNGVVKG